MNRDLIRQMTSISHSKKKSPIDCGDVNNHLLMVYEGIRKKDISIDRSVFRYTLEDKLLLKRLKKSAIFKNNILLTTATKEENNASQGKLIVYLRNDKHNKYFHSVRSFKCFNEDINNILYQLSNVSKVHDRLFILKKSFSL